MATLLKLKSPKNPARYCNNSCSQPLRIADILSSSASGEAEDEGPNDDVSDEGFVESCRDVRRSVAMDCSSPRRIVGRFLSRLRRRKVKRVKENETEFGGDRREEARRSMDGFHGGDAANLTSETAQSGQCRREESFNLGVGCCLLYLVAASKNELDKMMEMRMQMEAIVNKKAKEEFLHHTQHAMSNSSDDPNDASECFSISGSLGFENQTQLSPQSSSSAVTVCDGYLKFETPKHGTCLEGIDQMEAEFEAELARLQFHQMQRRLVFDDLSVSSEEVIDPVLDPHGHGAVAMASPCGVHPHELERKLHELLEARQREQIKELEDALECAKRKLCEKEMEVS